MLPRLVLIQQTPETHYMSELNILLNPKSTEVSTEQLWFQGAPNFLRVFSGWMSGKVAGRAGMESCTGEKVCPQGACCAPGVLEC